MHLIPNFLKTRSSLQGKPKPKIKSYLKQVNIIKAKNKEKSVMEYYHELLERPSKPSRTRYNFHKQVSSTNGYRTKLQKDPKISKNIIGQYIYIDTYDSDAKKQCKIIMSLN